MPSTRKKQLQPGLFVAYYRVSDKKQGEFGVSLEAQQAETERYIARENGTLLAQFTEVESGKSHKRRPQLVAAMALAKRNYATLLIAKLSRLARNVHFISGLLETGVPFVALDMPGATKMVLHFMAVVDEEIREGIVRATKSGLAQIQRNIERDGFHISKRSGRRITKLGNPRWRESIAKATAAHRKARPAELVEMMRQQQGAGKSLRAIAASLNTLGLRTPGGREWYASTVRAALIAAVPAA